MVSSECDVDSRDVTWVV